MEKKNDIAKKARAHVQRAMEQAEEEHWRLMLRKRIELASDGLTAYKKGKFPDAIRNFQTYIKILEDWKGVGEGGLSPSLFDASKDVAEMLLISGVYWDLVKLYDRTKSSAKQREFRHYLEKYILFSKGQPYQPLCAETLRKYISIERPNHRDDFKQAYKMISENRCFVATALVEECEPETIPRLRNFRDQYLQESAWGRALIRAYYVAGPWAAVGVEQFPERGRRFLARCLDRLADELGGYRF